MRLTVRGGWQQTEGEVGDGGGGGGVAVQWRHLEACCRALCEENQGSAAETRPKRWLPRTQRLRAADGVKWIYWTPAWRKTEGFIPFFCSLCRLPLLGGNWWVKHAASLLFLVTSFRSECWPPSRSLYCLRCLQKKRLWITDGSVLRMMQAGGGN